MSDIIEPAADVMGKLILPERVLRDVLRYGFDQIYADPTLVNDLFYKLDSAARMDAVGFFRDHKVTVRSDFPRDDYTLPIVAIQTGGENEKVPDDLLGDDMQFGFGLGEQVQETGHAMSANFNITCVAQRDANAATYLYYLAKAVLLINMPELLNQGLMNITMSGQPVQLREDLFPEHVFGRLLNVNLEYYFSVNRTERVANALTVRVFVENPETGIAGQVNVEAP